MSCTDSDQIISTLFYFSKWFAKSYAQNDVGTLGMFEWDFVPKEGEAVLSKKQLSALQDKLDNELDKFQTQLENSKKKYDELSKENELLKKQLADKQTSIEINKVEANKDDEIHHPRNEKDTRKYFIDVALREAGWDLGGAKDKEFKVEYMPKSTNKSETGFVDYVLWDDDDTPLALVEAKKSMESASKGENQAQLYADSLEKMYGKKACDVL